MRHERGFDTCACRHVRHVCCVYVLCWWQWGEVDLMPVLNPRSGSCSTVRGEALVHVVYMTQSLSGFRVGVSLRLWFLHLVLWQSEEFCPENVS